MLNCLMTLENCTKHLYKCDQNDGRKSLKWLGFKFLSRFP